MSAGGDEAARQQPAFQQVHQPVRVREIFSELRNGLGIGVPDLIDAGLKGQQLVPAVVSVRDLSPAVRLGD
jgi:uncharacterized protein YwlG (UPF0340 family)